VTVHEFVSEARGRLVRAGIAGDLAGLDAEVLARAALGWDRARFLAARHEEAPAEFPPRYEVLVERREGREPVSYITGTQEFWGLAFEVTRDVLIPRPETELIIEEATACLGDTSLAGREIVDAGTGSGCLAVVLALQFPEAQIVATDVSSAALAVARRNAHRHRVAHRVRFVEGTFLDGIEGAPALIVSNPPYVPPSSAPELQREVREFEPAVALFGGGADGLDRLRELLAQASDRLAPGGWLIVEFGAGQDDELTRLVARLPCFSLEKIRRDLQGIPRTAVMRRTS
jgi:release factor glutamine methyltransferase